MTNKSHKLNYGDCDGFCITPGFSPEAFRSAINYKPKPGDLFIVTYPKCGTTWMQFIVMVILRKGKPIKSTLELHQCTPFLEMAGADAIDFMKEPGAFKIHLPLRLTPFSSNAKYIYVARNPKDCCVSFYHHTKNFPLYDFEDGTFDEFFELFINGETDYEDYFDHLLPWYEHKDDPNVHFLTYEDLKKDTRSEVLKVAKFIGDEYYESLQNNPQQLEDVLYYSSLEYMKKTMNDSENSMLKKLEISKDIPMPSGIKYMREYMEKKAKPTAVRGDFVRKGIVGDWKNHFTPEQEERMEEWIRRRTDGSDVMNLWKNMQDVNP